MTTREFAAVCARMGLDPMKQLGRAEGVEAPKVPKSPMNKWETEYAKTLEAQRAIGLLRDWKFEGLSLRLAQGARFTPDFMVMPNSGPLELHEVKGYWREAAKVRIKVAAELFPYFDFRVVRKLKVGEGGGWMTIMLFSEGRDVI